MSNWVKRVLSLLLTCMLLFSTPVFAEENNSETDEISGVPPHVDVGSLPEESQQDTAELQLEALEEGLLAEPQQEEPAIEAETVAASEYQNSDDAKMYISFDENTITEGKYLDQSGNLNHGSINGSIEVVSGVDGGNAAALSNTNAGKDEVVSNFVNFGTPDALDFANGDFTISFWIKSQGNGHHDTAVISNKDYRSGNNPGFALGNFTDGSPDLQFNLNAVGASPGERSDIKDIFAVDGVWRHVAARVDRGKGLMYAYLDGRMVQKVSIEKYGSKSLDPGLDLVLGADGNKKYGANRISVDELRIYNRSLEEQEIQRLFHCIKNPAAILDKMEDVIKNIKHSYEFSQQDTERMLEYCTQAKSDLSNASASADILSLLTESQKEFDMFMKGKAPELSFFVLADTHVEEWVTHNTVHNFESALQDMKRTEPSAKALMMAGDNTSSGSSGQMAQLYKSLNAYNPIPDENTFITLGNHDVRGGGWSGSTPYDQELPYWKTIYPLYMQHNKRYMPDDNSGKTYYAREVDGYSFISLNTEASLKDMAKVSKEQADWLDQQLAKTAASGKPAFVMLHQPLKDTVWRSDAWHCGDGDSLIKEVLSKYPHAVYMSGHIHNGFGVTEAVDRTYGTMLDLPSFSGSENGTGGTGDYRNPGAGYVVKVYADYIMLRARNFALGEWMPEYDIPLALPGLPAVVKSASRLVQEQYLPQGWQALQQALADAHPYLNLKYPNAGWDTKSPPAQQLYSFETRMEISRLACQIKDAMENLVPIGLDSLKIVSKPTKTEYKIGEKFVPDGLKVAALYNDGTKKDLPADQISVEGFDSSQPGECEIRVSFENKTASFTVTILKPEKPGSGPISKPAPSSPSQSEGTQKPPAKAKVIKVQFPQKSASIVQGGKITIKAFAYTSSGSRVTLTYASSKPKVAQVSSGGVITAKQRGTTKITAQEPGGKKAVLTLTVLAKKSSKSDVKSVSANVPKTMKPGQQKFLSAGYKPGKASGVKISFKSSRPSVVSADSFGRLYARKKGSAVITIKAGKIRRKYKITVK